MLLQTSEHRLIVVIYMRATEARDIARTGVVALLSGRLYRQQNWRRHQDKRNDVENSEHLISLDPCQSMIRKSVKRFSEKIMLIQRTKAR
jgi:hypothetical protein